MKAVWFRNDLRIKDNPALFQAAKSSNKPLIGVYLLCQKQWQLHQVGQNQQSLILEAVTNLKTQLATINIPLVVVNAVDFKSVPKVFKQLIKKLKITDLYFNIEYPINERNRDKKLFESIGEQIKFHRFVGDSLVAPWKIANAQDQGYKVYSAFAKASYRLLDSQPLVVYPDIETYSQDYQSLNRQLNSLQMKIPKISPTADCMPKVEEHYLNQRLLNFVEQKVASYEKDRDYPAIAGTSELSAGLAIGALSVRQCYQVAKEQAGILSDKWISELMWRDFYRSVIWHYPHVCRGKAFLDVEKNIQWSSNKEVLEQCKSGQTGIPIIDAALEQLIHQGWMHNRLRMIVASYFCKNLWLDWRLGEAFFAQHLFDFDFSSNNGGWQWCASVGTDAAPYFRIFNPATQQKKFDPEANFIKQWLPQLTNHSVSDIHRFESKQLDNYPSPQVNLKTSRQWAIDAFKSAKAS